MYTVYALGLCVVALVIFYLLWRYPNRQTTLFVKVIVGLAWFASLSIVVSIPLDVLRTLTADKHDDFRLVVSQETMGKYWEGAFWSLLSFMVILLPFVQQYSESGSFTIKDRCVYAFTKNGGNMIAAAIVVFTGFALLLIVEHDLRFSKFVSFIMAAINAIGMVGVLCLLGYGLVDIPRQLWRKANLTLRMELLCQSAGIQLENAAAAHLELSKQVNSVHMFNGQFGRSDKMRPYMDVIINMLERVAEFEPQETKEDSDDYAIDAQTSQGLGILRSRLRKAIEGYHRERERYIRIIKDYINLHETIENISKRGWTYIFANGTKANRCCGFLLWWWRCFVIPIGQRFLAMCTGFFSVVIVVAEITIPKYLPNMSLLGRLLQEVEDRELVILFCTFLMLMYVMVCCYYTLFRMGRFSFYLLVPHHTAPFSLASNALLMCRFAWPLCFNFLSAVALPIKSDMKTVKGTQYWKKIGHRISGSPIIGKYYTTYFPCLLLPYVLLIAFDAINKVMVFLDPKKRFAFDNAWKLEHDSNYAALGKRMMNLELENHQKGDPYGNTITEGLRQMRVDAGVTSEFKKSATSIAPMLLSARDSPDTLKQLQWNKTKSQSAATMARSRIPPSQGESTEPFLLVRRASSDGMPSTSTMERAQQARRSESQRRKKTHLDQDEIFTDK